VVVACYLPPEAGANLLILEALTFSAGGSRIEIGENGRLLSDPYFPKHRPLPAELKARLRAYYDFAVRYGRWLGPAAANLPPADFELPAGVWALPRRTAGWTVYSLVNAAGLEAPRWDQAHAEPVPFEPFELALPVPDDGVRAVWWASPDRGRPALAPADWRLEAEGLRVMLPHLDTWTIVAIEGEAGA
jgi:dextranase